MSLLLSPDHSITLPALPTPSTLSLNPSLPSWTPLNRDRLLLRQRAVRTGQVNNSVIKSFAVDSTETLDLGPVAQVTGPCRHRRRCHRWPLTLPHCLRSRLSRRAHCGTCCSAAANCASSDCSESSPWASSSCASCPKSALTSSTSTSGALPASPPLPSEDEEGWVEGCGKGAGWGRRPLAGHGCSHEPLTSCCAPAVPTAATARM